MYSKGMSKKFGVRVIYRKIWYFILILLQHLYEFCTHLRNLHGCHVGFLHTGIYKIQSLMLLSNVILMFVVPYMLVKYVYSNPNGCTIYFFLAKF
jgi:hypothetical protein